MKLPLPAAVDELVYSMYRRLLWADPKWYRMVAPLFGGNGRFHVHCDLAVDGFARSGNTFVADMLRATQPAGFRFESHHHIPPFIMACCAHGTPTVLLVREPIDSVISLALHSGWSLRKSLDHYIVYHEYLIPYREKVFVARFSDFTRDFRQLVLDINIHFNLRLNTDFHHETVATRTLAAMDQRLSRQGRPLTPMEIHRPTEERRRLKSELLHAIQSTALQRPLRVAEQLYADYSATSRSYGGRDDGYGSGVSSAA